MHAYRPTAPSAALQERERECERKRAPHARAPRPIRETNAHAQPSAAPICFSHDTALRIARRRGTDRLRAKPSTRRGTTPPGNAPGAHNADRTARSLERAYPGLVLPRPLHILIAGDEYSRSAEPCVVHHCSKTFSAGSLLQLGGRTALCRPELAFIQMASVLRNDIALLELGFELCGTYRTESTASATAYNVPPLTTARSIRAFTERNSSLAGTRAIARVLPYLVDGSASPRETKLALMLSLPHARGGYGLDVPSMNRVVYADAGARAVSGRASFRCDLCWATAKLDVEYQSREIHANEASRIADSRRAHALSSMGWTVVGITNDELDSAQACDLIADTIRMRLGRRKRIRVSDYEQRKRELRQALGLRVQ